uniref:Putative membrane protein MJ1061 n=1 Tax=Anthurium amnicola TaxID=1678845 RepID=A0A1D1YFD5_9ARAE
MGRSFPLKSFPLKVFVDKEKQRVAFVEAGKDFVDILFSFLSSPLGKFGCLLGWKPSFGSVDNLYSSVKFRQGIKQLQTRACYFLLLRPRRAYEFLYDNLALNLGNSGPFMVFRCPSWTCCTEDYPFFSTVYDAMCPCGSAMSAFLDCIRPEEQEDGVFVTGGSKFLITDNLCVLPMSTSTVEAHLHKLGIEDRSTLEERTVPFSNHRLLVLMERSLVSMTPLTDALLFNPAPPIWLKYFCCTSIGDNYEKAYVQLPNSVGTDEMLFKGADKHLINLGDDVVEEFPGEDTSLLGREGWRGMLFQESKFFTKKHLKCLISAARSTMRFWSGLSDFSSKKMSRSKDVKVKLIRWRATKNVAFIEAGKDFVDILFSFLTIPLGGIIRLLDEDCSLGCIYNLYQSVEELVDAGDLVKPRECKSMLLSPRIATHSGITTQILRIEEAPPMKVIVQRCYTCRYQRIFTPDLPSKCIHGVDAVLLEELNPKLPYPCSISGGGFVKGEGKFTVTNNMRVFSCSAFHFLNKAMICTGLFEAREISIGEVEVLKLLKACLSSRSPLNDVFRGVGSGAKYWARKRVNPFVDGCKKEQ